VLPGVTDENIAVMAHTDSFFEGAMDNASGIGTMIELAEYYARTPKSQRRRTMTFFTSSAHHSPSGEDAGLRWIHNNMQAMFAKTALIVNCEHTSQVQTYLIGNSLVASNTVSARRWFVGGSDRLKAIVAKSFKTFGVSIYSRPETRPGGELGVVFTDAPSFHIIDHAFYHTDLDTAAIVPEAGLEAAVRAFAKIIDDVNQVDLNGLRAPGRSEQDR
jgi:Zn-dependent M28 family amino/carboxypeptidase